MVLSIVVHSPLVFAGDQGLQIDTPKINLLDTDNKSKPNVTKQSEEAIKSSSAMFYNASESIGLRTGGALNFHELNKTDGKKDVPYILGFNYMFTSETWEHFEMGADLHSDEKFYVDGGYKWIFDRYEVLRPYMKLGLALRFEQGRGIGTFGDLDKYSGVLAAGIEDLIGGYSSVRFDTEFYIGGSDMMAVLTVGYSFGW